MPHTLRPALLSLAALLIPVSSQAHPAPFTYLDLRLRDEAIDVALVAHIFDVAHDLNVGEPEQLLDAARLESRREAIFSLFANRLHVIEPGRAPQAVSWSDLVAAPERQSIVLRGRAPRAAAGAVSVDARMFPYDPAHQTFVNVYERDELTLQAILDRSKTALEYFPGSRQGVFALFARFVPGGMRHVAGGLEHWLFLAGLLLAGATRGLLLRLVLAFVAADALTTALLALGIVHPAARLTDPALALAIVYVGADNLLVRGGRDVRPWIALAFGVLHGFWFGGGLALMDLPRAALGWSLAAFDIGTVLAQTGLMLALGAAILFVRRRSATAGRLLATAGSGVVIAGGLYLFAQRVFFPGGLV